MTAGRSSTLRHGIKGHSAGCREANLAAMTTQVRKRQASRRSLVKKDWPSAKLPDLTLTTTPRIKKSPKTKIAIH